MSIRSLAYRTNKAYLSAITVTNIFQSFTYNMAAKTGWHRYRTESCHCRSMYIRAVAAVCEVEAVNEF